MKQHVMFLALVGCICLSSSQLLAAQKGHIQVTAPAGIKIFLDSSFKGTTNDDDGGLIIQNVEPGSYTIKAVKTNFAPQSMSLSVVAGEVKAVSLKKFIPKIQIEQSGGPDQKGMTLKTGTLIIQSLPIKCKITIAKVGISHSKTQPQWTAKKFPIGTYTISATSGSHKLTGEFTVKENSETKLMLNLLTKKPKTLGPLPTLRLFPVFGITLGQTTTAKLRQLGRRSPHIDDETGKPYKKYTVQGCFVIWYESLNEKEKVDSMSITHCEKMPKSWKRLGFNWDLSYNEWCDLFKKFGFTVKVEKQPSIVKRKHHQNYVYDCFNAKISVYNPTEQVTIILKFDFGSHGSLRTSPKTLWSIDVRRKAETVILWAG